MVKVGDVDSTIHSLTQRKPRMKQAEIMRLYRARKKKIVNSQCKAGAIPVDEDDIPLWDTLTKQQLTKLVKG